MQLQKQEKRICWECLRTPRNATQLMIGTLYRMDINNLRFLDGVFEHCYERYKKGRSELQEGKAETAAVQSKSVWEFRDGRCCQRYQRLARNWLDFRAMDCRTRSERKLHDEKLEEYRRGGLL